MFTGIVSDIGTITSSAEQGDRRVVVKSGQPLENVAIGASIACSGVCLTVVDKGPGWFAVDVSGETVSRTAPGQWSEGRRLNLERAMKLGDELGGHIVTGHVDGVAEAVAVEPEGDSKRVAFRTPSDLAPFLAPKGSVTVDGVSLTVNTVEDEADAEVLLWDGDRVLDRVAGDAHAPDPGRGDREGDVLPTPRGDVGEHVDLRGVELVLEALGVGIGGRAEGG